MLPDYNNGTSTFTTRMVENYDLNGNLSSPQTYSQIGSTLQTFRPVTKYVYDQLNRRKQTEVWTDENASSGTIMLKEEYDFTGRRTRQYDADNIATRYDYDGRGQLKAVVLAESTVDAATTTYACDEWGNQIGQSDAPSRVTRFEYDGMGRRTKRTLPGTAAETWTYDYPNGGPAGPAPNKKWNKVQHVDFGTVASVTEYDSRGRL